MRPWAIPPVFPVTSVDVDGFLCLEGSVPCSVRYELGMSTSRRSVRLVHCLVWLTPVSDVEARWPGKSLSKFPARCVRFSVCLLWVARSFGMSISWSLIRWAHYHCRRRSVVGSPDGNCPSLIRPLCMSTGFRGIWWRDSPAGVVVDWVPRSRC